MPSSQVVATVIQLVIAAALTTVLAKELLKEQLRATVFVSFLAMACTCKVGGLILGLPLMIILWLYFKWVRYVGQADTATKRVLWRVTLLLSGLYLVFQILVLSLRFQLNQPAIKIWASVAGRLAALAMYSAPMEQYYLRSRQRPDPPADFEDVEDVDDTEPEEYRAS